MALDTAISLNKVCRAAKPVRERSSGYHTCESIRERAEETAKNLGN